MQTFFLEGGPFMFATTLFGFLAMASAVLTLLRPGRYQALAALLLAVTLTSGLLGTCFGLIGTGKAMLGAELSPEQLALLGVRGFRESLHNVFLGLLLVLPALLVCTVAAYRAGRGSSATPSRAD